jgi:hypothetical protein
MRHMIWLLGALVLGGCSTRTAAGVPVPGDPDGRVVVIDDDAARSRGGEKHGRAVRVPPGHYPPPGECRIWYAGRPPGHQPPSARCESLVGRVPVGAFLLYNDTAWDTEYDWRRQASRRPGSVPDVVLRVMNGLVRS